MEKIVMTIENFPLEALLVACRREFVTTRERHSWVGEIRRVWKAGKWPH
jgi:hypothetical protein